MVHRDSVLRILLSIPFILFFLLILSIPISFAYFSKNEGDIFPVTVTSYVEVSEYTDDGIMINVGFEKIRSCEFIGVSWFDSLNRRIRLDFLLGEDDTPSNRPAIEGIQKSGPWLIETQDDLEDTFAYVQHRCHPLWVTHTLFYKGRSDES